MEDQEKRVARENLQSNQSSDNYEFMTETIKRRPVNKKKVFRKVLFTIVLAILFGIVASLTFILVYPYLKEKMNPEDGTRPVSFSVAEEAPPEDPVPEFIPPDEDPGNELVLATTTPTGAPAEANEVKDKNTEADEQAKSEETPTGTPEEVSDKDTTEQNNEDGKKEEQNNSEDGTDTESGTDTNVSADPIIVSQVVESVEKNLEIEDYRDLLRKISAISTNTQKSLVTVSAVSSDTDWFNNSFQNNDSTTGLIVADNGKELLIVSSTSIFQKSKSVQVTFRDGSTYPATIRKSDSNSGLSVVAVLSSRLSEETLEAIELAQFGSLAASTVSVPVLAVGAPYGVGGSVGMGQITSNSEIIDKTDSNMRILSTDIYGSTKASGVLVNYSGRIIGIICHESVSGDMPNLIRAYSISDISQNIEKISNGQELACLGIIGTEVTKDANEEHGVPFGAYVKEVVADSPAMKSGIRNGDVIVQLGDVPIDSFSEYKAEILKHRPGDILMVKVQRPGRDSYSEVSYEVTLEALL